MSYCLKPACEHPQNPEDVSYCLNCGSCLLVQERYRALKPIVQEVFDMHTSELFRLYISAENSFNQATLMEAKLVRATDSSTKPPIGTMPYVPLLLAPICFMIVWAIVVFTVSALCKVAQDKVELSLC